ncbi:hypothetical protein CEXT_55031 [Caerostris extrusa]|uniref:Uncharacterized protein n=1 Tax=Caerostris extrusa TaxID=172846 RepID=A0AAV4P5N9_CAEEX|nr:hypothetical protein CEXT_55031 [Caerostris extrusa]
MCQERSNEALMHLQKARRLQTTVIANPSSALLLCFTRSTDNNPCAPQDRCPLARLEMRARVGNNRGLEPPCFLQVHQRLIRSFLAHIEAVFQPLLSRWWIKVSRFNYGSRCIPAICNGTAESVCSTSRVQATDTKGLFLVKGGGFDGRYSFRWYDNVLNSVLLNGSFNGKQSENLKGRLP